MRALTLSTCVTTGRIDQSREFYVKYFGARVVFDCGWYVNLQFGNESSRLQFMSPRNPNQPVADSAGLTFNFRVDDVDFEHERIVAAGLEIVSPIEDHPWGDRAFAILDPNWILLYIHTETEPSEEYRKCYC